ncbi:MULTISPECIES: response regulator [Niveibacterium]|uniref:Response regulator n=1 Tax=Niveibacterium microcysteis TaxID=2811415 RepID=A0ABX7M880_9RHOO|nr:response regulator [Niveibacterium microcysteis]QSI77964.1 response regulator [Niveibacterium microcysteis]
MSDLHALPSKPEREYCSTSEAAQMLGVSLGTVQQMVENGLLEAWKTAGGHRRIRIGSVEDYLRRRSSGVAAPHPVGVLRILVAEDDRILQRLYAHTFETWNLPIEVRLVESGFDGLLEIGRQQPDLLISDLVMPGLDGFAMISKLRSDPKLEDMDIIVVTGLSQEDIAERGGLPDDVTIYGKPVPFKELKGYIQARLAQFQRRGRAAS